MQRYCCLFSNFFQCIFYDACTSDLYIHESGTVSCYDPYELSNNVSLLNRHRPTVLENLDIQLQYMYFICLSI